MLTFSFVFVSLAISVIAAPSPYELEVKGVEASATFGDGASPTEWWRHHGHGKWRSAWHHNHGHHAVQTPTADSSAPAPEKTPCESDQPPATNEQPAHTSSSEPSSPSTNSTSGSAVSSSPSPTESASHTQSASHTTPSVPAAAAAYLNPHNALRAKHSAKPLTWSNDLAAAAQTWANKCQWGHSGGAVGNFGENIAAGTGNYDAASAVAAWASEEPQYNPSNPVYSHYTQMVWKATTQLGCASAKCKGLINADTADFHVCEYNPAGNVLGQFPENVL